MIDMDLHSTLEFIYKCFIAIGLIIPALSLILSGIDIIGLDDVDLNMEGTDGADAFNVSCLMLGMVVTGAFGIWLDDILTTMQALLVSLGIGTIAYVALLKLVITPLKNSRAKANIIRDFKGKIGKVTVTIPADGTGEVEVESRIGRISYMAKANHSDFMKEDIHAGANVMVVDIDRETLIVTKYIDERD